MQQNVCYSPAEELDEELNINIKKIFMILMNRKYTIIKVFCTVFLFFILLAFILPKKYEVNADLYINKTNNSNISEINPFVIDEMSGNVLSMGVDKTISNELELMRSPLVINKVIIVGRTKLKMG